MSERPCQVGTLAYPEALNSDGTRNMVLVRTGQRRASRQPIPANKKWGRTHKVTRGRGPLRVRSEEFLTDSAHLDNYQFTLFEAVCNVIDWKPTRTL